MRSHAITRARRAPLANDEAVLLATLGDVEEGGVWKAEQDLLKGALGFGELSLEASDLLAERAAARDQLVGRLAGAPEPRDLLRGGVARGLALLDGLDGDPAVALELRRTLEERRLLVQHTAAAHRLAQRVELLAKDADVVHG